MDSAVLERCAVIPDNKPSNSDVRRIDPAECVRPGILSVEDRAPVAAVEHLTGFGCDGDAVGAGREAESCTGGSLVYDGLHVSRRVDRLAGTGRCRARPTSRGARAGTRGTRGGSHGAPAWGLDDRRTRR